MKFNSIFELVSFCQDEEACTKYFERRRWGDNPVCPHCGAEIPYRTNRGFKCRKCHKKFTVKVGTFMENSKLPMRTWFLAIYLTCTSKKGISSTQLSRLANITQKTAWFLLQRIREAMKDHEPVQLGRDNPVEIDEAYIGGKERYKHYSLRKSKDNSKIRNDGQPSVPKKMVLGMVERKGKVIMRYIRDNKHKHVIDLIGRFVPRGSTIYTDKHMFYRKLSKKYCHGSINHQLGVYKKGDICTNAIENIWSTLKRGITGIYHQVSDKHLDRYLAEFVFRFNTRNRSDFEKFEMVISKFEGRLSYSDLIAEI